jgi:hypothetical protein
VQTLSHKHKPQPTIQLTVLATNQKGKPQNNCTEVKAAMSRHFITHNLPAGLSTAAYSTIKNEMTPPSQKEQLYWEGKRMEEQLLVKSRLPLNPAARNKSLEFEKYSEPTATGAERETVKEKKEELGILDTDGSEDNGDGASSHDNSSCPKPASITTTTNSLFEIRSTPNKGYSIFAKSSITKGTLILAEKPLLRITKAHYLAEHVAQAVEKLSEEDKKKYWGLASAHGQDGSK